MTEIRRSLATLPNVSTSGPVEGGPLGTGTSADAVARPWAGDSPSLISRAVNPTPFRSRTTGPERPISICRAPEKVTAPIGFALPAGAGSIAPMSEHVRRAAVVTVSDGVAAGVRDDASGRALVAALVDGGFEVVRHDVVPDERERIAALLAELAAGGAGLVVTTGGTGLGPRDVTPEATRDVIDREAPGIAEEMRASGRGSTPFAALSRGLAGSVGSTLILNLPGSERGALESLRAILPVLPHALDLLAGDTVHGPGDARTAAEHAGEGHAGETDHPHRTEPEIRGGLEGAFAERREAGERVAMVTAVRAEGAPPCRVGQKVLVGPDGPIAGTLGCAEFDAGALEAAREAFGSGEPSTRTLTHDLGSIEVYVEPAVHRPLLLIFSATPVAAALARWAPEVGFDPVVVEPRAERHPGFHAGAARVAASLAEVPPAAVAGGFAVHTDHDAPGVADSLAALLATPAPFVGVMGSARHVGAHIEALRAAGASDEQLARLRTPVGLDIGARSAEEIALAILAGMVAARAGRDGGWLDRRGDARE